MRVGTSCICTVINRNPAPPQTKILDTSLQGADVRNGFFFWGGGGAAGIREHMSCIRGISRLVGVLTGSASSSPVTLQGVMECIDGNRAPASD